MSKKSASLCIEDLDFESAFERLQNTNSQWHDYWFDTCVEILTNKNCPKKYQENYTIHPRKREIEKAKPVRIYKTTGITWDCEKEEFDKGEELLYVIEMLNRYWERQYYKVGTTTRSIEQRMYEHLRYYAKEDIKYIRIKKVYNCNGTAAEGLESLIRAYFIKHHSESFRKNDRFCDIEMPMEEIDRLIAMWENTL